MFCPKCGTQNPETGKFCRSCGTDLGNVGAALTGKLPQGQQLFDRKGRPISWDRAIIKLFTGIAFLVISVALAASGKHWWYWMLIPGFVTLGTGIAQFIMLKKSEQGGAGFAPMSQPQINAQPPAPSLPPTQTPYVSPAAESRYKTGELVPPSVTENTTRHLEADSEGETMTLPKL